MALSFAKPVVVSRTLASMTRTRRLSGPLSRIRISKTKRDPTIRNEFFAEIQIADFRFAQIEQRCEYFLDKSW